MHKNQKGGLPRLVTGAGLHFSRGKILDGTTRAYFGPGQPPSSGADVVIADDSEPWQFTADAPDPTHDTIFNSGHRLVPIAATPTAADAVPGAYLPPGDWPKAGMLLRIPQVVWLSSAVPVAGRDYVRNDGKIAGGNNHIQINFTFDSTPEEEIEIGNLQLGLDGLGATYFPVYLYFARYKFTDRYLQEHARRLAVYANVKAAVEALRPGRTFVDVIDWAGDNSDQWARFGGGRYLHALTPPTDGDASLQFGTDFLHIYAGNVVLDIVSGSGVPVRVVDTDWAVEFASASATAAWGQTLDRLDAAYPLFAGYAVRVYGQDLGWTDADGAFSADLVLTNYAAIPARATAEAVSIEGAMIANDISEMRAQLQSRDSSSRTVLENTSALLADYGVSYEGDASLLTEDSLLALIADHYGFDPGTGEDLG